MTYKRSAAIAAALLATTVVFGGSVSVLAQDFDRDRERLRKCNPGSQDCVQLREQIADRLRDRDHRAGGSGVGGGGGAGGCGGRN